MTLPAHWTVIARQYRGGAWLPSENPLMSVADARRMAQSGELLMANRPVVSGTSRHFELVVKARVKVRG